MSFSLGKFRKANKESSSESEPSEDSLEPATLRVALAICGECGLNTSMVMISQSGSSRPQSAMLPVAGGLRGNSHGHPNERPSHSAK